MKNKLLLLAGTALAGLLAFAQPAYAEEVNVIDYGADGTDNEDDRAAIQKALNLAVDTDEELTVIIPEGTYYLKGSLVVYSNTHIIADGATIYRMNQSYSMLVSDKESGAGGYGQFSNITVEGGVWDADGSSGSSLAIPMIFLHGSNLSLKDLTVKNGSGKHLVIAAGVDGITVDNVTFDTLYTYSGSKNLDQYYTITKSDGSYDKIGSYRSMEALHLDLISGDGKSEYNAQPYDNTPNKNVRITNCTFSNCYSGVGSHYEKATVDMENYTISDNTFKNVAYTAINLYYVDGASITGNNAVSVGEFVRANNSDYKISNNTINISPNKKMVMYGIYSSGSTGNIDNNTFAGTTDNAISVYSSTLSSISENTIKNAEKHGIGIYTKSKVDKVDGNTISDSKFSGIYLTDSETVISNNTITNSGKYGISADSFKKLDIKGNTINKSGTNAIALEGKSVSEPTVSIDENIIDGCNIAISVQKLNVSSINSNNIKGNKGNAIQIVSGSKVAAMNENIIDRPTKIGIVINGASTVGELSGNKITRPGTQGLSIVEKAKALNVKNNTISSPGKYGIYISKSTAKLQGNTITDSVDHSINASDNSEVEIISNKISNSKTNGIYIQESSAVINKNTVEKAGNIAIHINNGNKYKNCKISIEENTIKSPKTIGISIYNTNSSKVLKNTISSVKTNGIRVDKSSNVVLSNNIIPSAGKYGIFVTKSTVKMQGNTITDSIDHAINASDNSSVEILSNKIISSKANGIYIQESSAVIKKNTVEKAGNIAILVNNGNKYKNCKISIEENTVKTPKNVGISIFNTNSSKVLNNTVSSSKSNGIKVDKSNSVTLSGNKISNSSKWGVYVTNSDSVVILKNYVTKSGDYGMLFTNCKKLKVTGNESINNAKKDICANASNVNDSKTACTGTFTNNYASTVNGIVAYNSPQLKISGSKKYTGSAKASKVK